MNKGHVKLKHVMNSQYMLDEIETGFISKSGEIVTCFEQSIKVSKI